MYRPNSRWTWSFVIITCIQAAIILGFESYVFARFQSELRGNYGTAATSRTIPTFLTLYIFGFVYELILTYDALRLKNTIQVIGICLCNVGLLIYGAVQTDQIREAILALNRGHNIDKKIWPDVKPFLVAIPIIIGIGSVLMMFVAWKLYDEFAWTIYKHISADLRMKRRYLTYQIYIALLKFDFFFFLGFTVQFVVIVTDKKATEYILTIIAIPCTILILLSAAWSTRRENTPGMIITILLYHGGLAYFLFKLVRMYTPPRMDAYKAARTSLTFFTVITIALIIMTIINACICTNNFNKGLKPHISSRKVNNDDEKPNTTELSTNMKVGELLPVRMTID
ncbi:hypothetical protein PABG_01317 [Paracoccidioides brasiliensis Pb03]|uniref:Uncharacterized protein n=2 Tax=Paracoccidioides brasiliensis TaxID=121759 RepID=C1G9G6_PARBD|nr:uncharacterized protein PADG_03902 [Paracoccidioides brasiliensis Pb18]EEH18998.2 hypothetical protein PABG_01317 [Paracoccidioides brasiliensis Pb03]EEH47818.1 hypothetical protein PADG_03902 [Paracoccidioides brasiliensis Pb18]ODH50688.1 hypothetical protein GX48_03196 [Paracoccidioides brasiliensis]